MLSFFARDYIRNFQNVNFHVSHCRKFYRNYISLSQDKQVCKKRVVQRGTLCIDLSRCDITLCFDTANGGRTSDYVLASYTSPYSPTTIMTPAVVVADSCLVVTMGCVNCTNCYTFEVIHTPKIDKKTPLFLYCYDLGSNLSYHK